MRPSPSPASGVGFLSSREFMALVAGGQARPGTSGDVDYAVQAATAWPATLLRALRASREIKAGCVWINNHVPIVSEMPLGGSK